MIKVLVWGLGEYLGGLETFILGYIQKIDASKIQFDFINTCGTIAIEKYVDERGGKVFHLTSKKKNYIKYKLEIRSFMKTHHREYNVVWLNDCVFGNLDILKLAKKYGIQKRIIHAHNSMNMQNFIRLVRHRYNVLKLPRYATDYWACSYQAAQWTFGRKILRSCSTEIIPNAINLENFSYNVDSRKKIRAEFNLKDKFVVGNVGRLHFQKNQLYLLDIFVELLKYRPEAVLILVGGGPDKAMLESKAKHLQIDEKVIYTGSRSDVAMFYQAFDLFILPSKFEGLGIVAIEAQAAGLPCIVSDTLPEEAFVTENICAISLDESPKVWAEKSEIFYSKVTDRIMDKALEKSVLNINNAHIAVEELLGSNAH